MSTTGSGRGTEVEIKRVNKTALVKNRAPAPIQISAEQLLREAKDRKIELEHHVPRQQITDTEELVEYRMRRRKEYEDQIRMQRHHLGNYIKYASWEEQQHEFERARSVYERGVDVDYRNVSIWLKYSEMEMRNKFVNHARNVYDRAVQLLPRVDQFWFKYSYMEEMLGNAKLARQIYERWMKWEPDDNAFGAYIKFEMRQNDATAARAIFERYIDVHPTLRAYLKYARWEEKQAQYPLCRQVFERALVELPDEDERNSEKLFILFAQFEERQLEHDRTRAIYKYALDQLGREKMPELYQEFITFEKKHGSKDGIEEVIVGKRRLQYEESVAAQPHDYDAWFDYIRLEEAEGDIDRTRDVYERAIAQVPPVPEKRFWRRYIYLWVNYALFEELIAEDVEQTRAVYKKCLAVIPHEEFSFTKIWVMYAHFEVRQRDVTAARKVMGQAIGRCAKLGKEKPFKEYIHLERQLGEVDRCRTLYTKYLEAVPTNCAAWGRFAALESALGETARSRAVFEIAVNQPVLDMPEALWKAYIDFEIEQAKAIINGEADEDEEGEAPGEPGDRVRELYNRLLDRTKHVKVWVSFASFEASAPGGGGMEDARSIFRKAYDALKEEEGGMKDERVLLLEAWRDLEKSQPRDKQELGEVTKMMPRKLKKRRMVMGDDGEEQGWEEYYDYSFPDEEKAPVNLKILEMAHMWKKRKAEGDP